MAESYNGTNGNGAGAASIREVHGLLAAMEARLDAKIDKLEERATSRGRWLVTTLIAIAGLIIFVLPYLPLRGR